MGKSPSFYHLHELSSRLDQWMNRWLWGRALRLALKNYAAHGCVFMTGALSFYAIVSLIPLVFIALIVLAGILGDPGAHDHLATLLGQYLLPGAVSTILDQGSNIYQGTQDLVWSWWALPVVVWTGIRFYESLHHTLTMAWGGTEVRPFLHSKMWTIFAFIGASLFFGITISITTAATTYEVVDKQILGLSTASAWVLLRDVLPWLLTLAMFFMLYKFMPNTYVPPKLAFYAAIPVSVVWNLMKIYFTNYVTDSAFLKGIYGPLTGIVLLMVWIYTSAVIILFGAEYAAAWQKERDLLTDSTHTGPATG